MRQIEIITGNASLIDRIEPLWHELNNHHASVSKYFSRAFEEFTFELRKQSITREAENGDLMVEIAMDSELKLDIGYCITAIDSSKRGEIESIFIQPEFRSLGIGDKLMKRAMDWLENMKVSEKTVVVAYGNEQAFNFYAKYGFLPRITVLRHIDN